MAASLAFPDYEDALNLDTSQIEDVLRIARAIHSIRPKLPESKYLEYGLGIYRASLRYEMGPEILIAITQQESTFREKLPEGRHGEIGICQIRKIWLKNRKFIKEFGRLTKRDLLLPANSFLIAAWILKDLRDSTHKGRLPFWSYFNGRKFESRFRYFMAVRKNAAKIIEEGLESDAQQSDAHRVRILPPPQTETLPFVHRILGTWL